MVSGIILKNFKSFSRPGKISFKPITLIFGNNSSGKSSIINSILLLRQSLSPRYLRYDFVSDDKYAQLFPSGELVNLGSYLNFVNGMDEKKDIEITFEIKNFKVYGLEQIYIKGWHEEWERLAEIMNDILISKEIYLKFFISFDESFGVFVSKYEFGTIGDGKIIEYIYDRNGNYNAIPELKHFFWTRFDNFLKKKGLRKHELKIAKSGNEPFGSVFNAENLATIYPSGCLPYCVGVSEDIFGCGFKNRVVSNILGWKKYAEKKFVDPAMYLIFASMEIAKFLNGVVHIGPFRNHPKRFYLNKKEKYEHNDYGLEWLCNTKNSDYVDKLNQFLKKASIGYRMEIERVNVGVEEQIIPYCKNISTGVKTPIADVGYGLSQVMPVVAASMAPGGCAIIQQPELHLHPAAQADLGDLFIDGKKKKSFIIETHSEHLILRLLRRIRETSNKRLPAGVSPL
ncbi:MAG: hypothetical protein D6707_06485, partial [Bacteroidetes bacterium]